jgi:hypothetical protein
VPLFAPLNACISLGDVSGTLTFFINDRRH